MYIDMHTLWELYLREYPYLLFERVHVAWCVCVCVSVSPITVADGYARNISDCNNSSSRLYYTLASRGP